MCYLFGVITMSSIRSHLDAIAYFYPKEDRERDRAHIETLAKKHNRPIPTTPTQLGFLYLVDAESKLKNKR